MSLLVLTPRQLRELQPGGWLPDSAFAPGPAWAGAGATALDRPHLVEQARRALSRRLWAAMLAPPAPVRLTHA